VGVDAQDHSPLTLWLQAINQLLRLERGRPPQQFEIKCYVNHGQNSGRVCPNPANRHIRLVGQPVTLSRTPTKMAARPPEVGEHTEELLAEFGFSPTEITALRQAKVV
jgi:hypothetical protein